MPLRTNDTPLPHHVLVKYLGSGAMGEVWLVRGPGGVHKAAKFIRLEARHGIKELLAIQRMKQIHHPHLVQVTDVWLLDHEGQVIPDEAIETFSAQLKDRKSQLKATITPDIPQPDLLVVAMTLAHESLFDRLEKVREQGLQGIPYHDLIRYMEEAAKGIDFLNQPHDELGGKALQHCDIKPQNMLLVGDSVQICDFGLARLVGERKTNNQLEGTLAYIAPEAAKGQQPTPTTDQYSLAISYYELRTGHLPFDETGGTYAILDAHTSGNLDFSLVPANEQVVLKKATSLDPEKRYATNRAFVEALVAANATEIERKPKVWPLAMAIGSFLLLTALVVVLALFPPFKPKFPQIELPPNFQSDQKSELVQIGDRMYPSRIVRAFPDGDRALFLLIYEPRAEQLFYIMENKCWNGLFRKYVDENPSLFEKSEWMKGGRKGREDVGASDLRLPVLRVTVDEAHGFAVWLAGTSNGRLPSIKQWHTAAGLYRPQRSGSGPYLEPYTEDEIAVNRKLKGPMRVGEASKDVSPFGVRDMAGNGQEFTRTLSLRQEEEVPLPNATAIDAVLRRGRSYAAEDGPLKFADLQNSEMEQPWPYPDPEAFTSFRVVIEKLSTLSESVAPQSDLTKQKMNPER